MQEYPSVGDAAKRLGVVPATVKLMVRSGRLQPVAKTAGGIALFDPSAVERLVAVRRGDRDENEDANDKNGGVQ